MLIIGAKCKQGQTKNGVDYAPEYIYPLFEDNLQDIALKEINFSTTENGYQILYDTISNNIDQFRLTIGGDHSIAVSTIQPLVEKYMDDLVVIWIDAHADINIPESSPSGNIHGMPLGALTGLMDNWYKTKTDNKLKFNQIIYVGIRDLDPFEKETVEKYNIKVCNDIQEIEKLIQNKKVHISLDIDGIDPIYMPSTGTPVNNGLSMDFVCDILNMVHKYDYISCDLVEYNPFIGTDEQKSITKGNIKKLLNKII